MFEIKTMNKISPSGLSLLPGELYAVDSGADPDGILVRSAELKETVFPESLLAIARAGAGVNNIPIDRCTQEGIAVFNTPGANANAVKELVLCGLLLASRKVPAGMAWVRETAANGEENISGAVEKGKSAFVGPEIAGKTLGIIGLGAIGAKVAQSAAALGMSICGYDPLLPAEVARDIVPGIQLVEDLDALYACADYISLHLPLNANTRGMIGAANIAKMKDGVRIVNMARGELANDAELTAALESGKVACYVTDFPNNAILNAPNVVAIPHLGASTPESEDNCAAMAAQEIRDYLEDGNVKNSVNLPALTVARASAARICVIHANDAEFLAGLQGILAGAELKMKALEGAVKGSCAYCIVDVDEVPSDAVAADLAALPGVLRVRVI